MNESHLRPTLTLCLLVLAAAVLLALPASANTITVNTMANGVGDGNCNLREAVANANANSDVSGGDCTAGAPGLDTIVFSISGTTTLTSTITITDSIIIDGTGASVAIGGGNTVRLFSAPGGTGGTITFKNIALLNGNAGAGNGAVLLADGWNVAFQSANMQANQTLGSGAVLYLTNGASLSVTGSIGSNNSAAVAGGVFYFDGSGPVSVDGTFENNFAKDFSVDGAGPGQNGAVLAIINAGAVTVTGVYDLNNAGDSGGVLYVGTASSVSLDFCNSFIIGSACNVQQNNAVGNGAVGYFDRVTGSLSIHGGLYTSNDAGLGGVFAFNHVADCVIDETLMVANLAEVGGAIAVIGEDAVVRITRSTIAGNNATSFGGGVAVVTVPGAGTVTIQNSTLNLNVAGSGGAVYVSGIATTVRESTIVGHLVSNIDAVGSTVSLTDDIIGDDTSAVSPTPDLVGGPFVSRYSLIENTSGATLTDSGGNQFGIDPHIQPISILNGGPTSTVPLSPDSPAINAGDPAFVSPPATDQREQPRVAGGRIDMGAVEHNPGTVTLLVSSDSVSEGGGSITVTARRTGGFGDPVTADYTTIQGTATANSDYTPVSGTFAWNLGDFSDKSVTIPILEDSLYEGAETFTFNLTSTAPAFALGSPATETITINDNDAQPVFSIDSVSHAEGNSGTTPFTFTVTKSGSTELSSSVQVSSSDGSATTADGDYQAVSTTLNFLPGDTSKTVTVNVNGDTKFETDETFTVALSNPINATINVGTGTGTVQNDDARPSISIDSVSHAEGNSGVTTFLFTVSLSNPSTETVSVAYTTSDGTATAGSDYTAVSGTLTFAPGTTTQTVNVAVSGDTLNEADETFTVTLSGPTNATIVGGAGIGIGTIQNDDALPSLSINSVTQAEGNSGSTNFAFVVTLSAPSAQIVTVGFATANGTATAGSDYTAASGMLTFNPGTTTQTINVPVLGDTLNETDETFTVTLSGPTNATIAGGTGTGTIQNDDALPSLAINNVTRAEGNSGSSNFAFVVTLSVPSGQTVTVGFATANGTATAGSDYTAASGTLTFNPGTTTQTINVPVLGDTTFENDETFTVTLSNATNATIIVPTGTGTIQNDDAAPTADLSITKTLVGPNVAGSNLVYTIAVTNAGPAPASDVVVTDALPAGTTFVSATPTQGSCSGTTIVSCNFGVLSGGASASLDLTIQSSATAGQVVNTATVVATELDPFPANNIATATTTTVATVPMLSWWVLIALAAMLAVVGSLRGRLL